MRFHSAIEFTWAIKKSVHFVSNTHPLHASGSSINNWYISLFLFAFWRKKAGFDLGEKNSITFSKRNKWFSVPKIEFSGESNLNKSGIFRIDLFVFICSKGKKKIKQKSTLILAFHGTTVNLINEIRSTLDPVERFRGNFRVFRCCFCLF